MWMLELNSGSLEEQEIVLTTDPSLSLRFSLLSPFFLRCFSKGSHWSSHLYQLSSWPTEQSCWPELVFSELICLLRSPFSKNAGFLCFHFVCECVFTGARVHRRTCAGEPEVILGHQELSSLCIDGVSLWKQNSERRLGRLTFLKPQESVCLSPHQAFRSDS